MKSFHNSTSCRMVVIYVLCGLLTISYGKEFIMEAENNRTMANHEVVGFNNATMKTAVIVKKGAPFSINFCIRQRSFVTLQNVRFLNFNNSVFIDIYLNDRSFLGTYFAVANINDSKIFFNTGSFPWKNELATGWNVLKVHTGQSVAIDTFTLDIQDKKMNYPIFNCQVVCIDQSHFPVDTGISSSVSPATMTQNSFYSKCAEVDNVDIPIYHSNVKEFSVTAKLPQYKSFSNRRQANLTFCPHLTQTLWEFYNFTATPHSNEMSNNLAFMTFAKGNSKAMLIILMFRLSGEKSGSINADMGSRLILTFKSLAYPVNILMRYKNRNGTMVHTDRKEFNPTFIQRVWSIPDFTWVEDDYNYITLNLSTDSVLKFDIENLKLERRPFVADKTIEIYKSDDFIVEGILVDMWWRGHDRMNIRLSNGNLFEGFAFLRIYKPTPWTQGYGQIFILYQDGNARFLPMSPEGLDWIPFGTSVILGQVKHRSRRPYVSISQVDIFLDDLRLNLFFKDGGSIRMSLKVTTDYTRAFFYDIKFINDTNTYPFITVRSMYVEEGNTDVDSIKVDDTTTYNILDKWGSISGKSFAFHRRCVSKHLTLSPDIQIDILKT